MDRKCTRTRNRAKRINKNTKIILKESGLLAVSVPNDFSMVQMDLLKKGKLKNKEYWISPPDHLSYFNKETLIRFFEEFNFNLIDLISDYPIDLNLYCDLTNYVDKKSIGGKVHKKRIEIENLFSSISDEKTNNLYRCFADLGIDVIILQFSKKLYNGYKQKYFRD